MTTEEWKVGAWERLQANPDYLDKLLNVHPNDKKLFMPLLYEMYLEHDATPPQVVTQSLPLQHRVSTARQRLETQAKRARPEAVERAKEEVGKIGEEEGKPAPAFKLPYSPAEMREKLTIPPAKEAIPTEASILKQAVEKEPELPPMREVESRHSKKIISELYSLVEAEMSGMSIPFARSEEVAEVIRNVPPYAEPDMSEEELKVADVKQQKEIERRLRAKGLPTEAPLMLRLAELKVTPEDYAAVKEGIARGERGAQAIQIVAMAGMLGVMGYQGIKGIQYHLAMNQANKLYQQPGAWKLSEIQKINQQLAKAMGLNPIQRRELAKIVKKDIETTAKQGKQLWSLGVQKIAQQETPYKIYQRLYHQGKLPKVTIPKRPPSKFIIPGAKKLPTTRPITFTNWLNTPEGIKATKNIGKVMYETFPPSVKQQMASYIKLHRGQMLPKVYSGWIDKTLKPQPGDLITNYAELMKEAVIPKVPTVVAQGGPNVVSIFNQALLTNMQMGVPLAQGMQAAMEAIKQVPTAPPVAGAVEKPQIAQITPKEPIVISDAMVNALKVSQRGIKVLVQGAQKAAQAGNNEEALRLLHEARAATQSAKVGGAIDKALQGIPEAEKIVPEAFSPAHIQQMKAQARDTRSLNNLQDLDKRFDRSNKALGIQAARKIQQGAVDEGGELLHQGVEQQEAQLLVAQANEAMQAGDKQKVLDLLDQARPLITSERLLESVDKLAFSIQNPPSTPKPPEGSDAGFLGDQYGRANVDRTLGEAEKGPPFLQRIQQWYHRFYAQNVGGLQSHANWAADAAKKAADKHYVAVKKVEQEGLKPAIASARTAWKATDITDAEGHPFSYKKALDQVRLYLKAKEAPVGHEVLERLEKELTGYPPEMFRIAEIQNRTEAMKRQNKLIKDMHETVEILFRTNLGVEGTISKVLSTYGTYTVDAQGYMTRTGESYQDIVRPVYRQGLGEASENLWVALRNLEFAKNGVSIPDYYGLYQNDRLVGIVEQDMPHLKNYAKSHDLEIKVVGKIPQHLTDKEGNAVYEIRSLDGIDAAEATVADYSKHPDQQLLFDTNKREVALMRRLLDEMKNVGLISQESFDAMVAKGNYYLPIARIFEELQVGTEGEEIALIVPGTDLTRGTENTFKHLQHVTGTKETNKIVPPGMETVNYIAQAIRLIENHRAAQSLLDLHKITNEFMGELPQEADRALLTKMEQELKPMKLNEQLSKADKKAGYRTVATVSHGVPVQYRVHPELYKTLRGTSGQEMNAALKLASQILSPVARSLRVGTTGALGFEFMLRNMPRDLIEQWRNDPLLRYTPFINLPIGVWVLLKGHTVNALANWGVLPKIEKALGVKPGTILSKDTLQQYYTSGAGLATMMEALGLPRPDIERVTFQLQYGSLEARAKYIEATWRSPNLNSAQKAKAIAKELNVPEIVVLELLEHVKNQTELVTRVGLFAWHKIRGHSDKKAAYWSRVSSVDFAQRGYSNLAKALVKSTAYLGPAANSIDQFFRRWTKTPLNALITGLILTLGAVGIWLRNNLDPKRRKVYQSLSADTKNLYFCFITEVDKKTAEDWYNSGYVEVKSEEERYYLVYKAPKPFESAAIFCTLPELSLDWLISQDPHALDDAPKALAQSFGFPLIPTALLPLIEVSINPERGGYSFFYGRHIAPANVWGLTRAEQYTPSTPQPYVAAAQTKMAKRLGIAPWQVEYIVSRYIGPGGAQLIKAFDQPMREKGIGPERPLRPTIPKVKQYLTRVLVGGEPMGFGTRQAEEFGDLYYGPRGIQKSYNTLREKINNVWDESHLQHAESYITPEVLAYPFFNEANGIVGLFSGIKRVATNSRALTPDEMANYMTQMDYFITQVHDITLNEYNQFKEKADDWSVTQKQEYLLDYKEGRMTEQEEHLWDNLEPYLIPSIGVSAGRKTVEEVVDDLWTRLSTAQRTARTNKDEVLWQQIEDNLNALDELEKTLMNKL